MAILTPIIRLYSDTLSPGGEAHIIIKADVGQKWLINIRKAVFDLSGSSGSITFFLSVPGQAASIDESMSGSNTILSIFSERKIIIDDVNGIEIFFDNPGSGSATYYCMVRGYRII